MSRNGELLPIVAGGPLDRIVRELAVPGTLAALLAAVGSFVLLLMWIVDAP